MKKEVSSESKADFTPLRITNMEKKRIEIAEIIFEFVNAGFTVELNKHWFVITETFKSTARENICEEKELFSSVGMEKFTTDGYMRITLQKLKDLKSTYLIEPPTN